MRRIYIAILYFFIMILPGYSISYLGLNSMSDLVNFYGVRSLGMGNTGIAASEDYSAIMVNPAALYTLDGIYSGMDMRIVYNSEHIMDFESPVVYDSSFNKFKFSSLYVAGKAMDYISFGAGLFPVIDFNYYSSHSIPETSAEKYGVKTIDSSGSLDAYALALSINIPDIGALGFSLDILRGSKKLDESIVYNDNQYGTSSKSVSEYDYSGIKFNIGAYYSVNRMLAFGAKIDFGYDLKEKEDNVENIYTLPMSMGIGFVYRNFIRYDTQITMDIIYSKWGDYKVKYGDAAEFTPAGYHNIVSYRIGVEHLVGKSKRDSIPVRLGYYYQPFAGDNAYSISAVTAGVGFPFRPVMINLSMDYGKRSYRGNNVFFSADKLVDETLINIVFNIDYKF